MQEKYVKINKLQVSEKLSIFVNDELLKNTNVSPENFWLGLEKTLYELAPKNRELIKFIEDTSKVKEQVSGNKMLMELYDDCCQEISIFRSQHLRYAADYIHNQSTKSTLFGSGGSKVRGTGGTPFMKYLKKHRDETDSSKIKK